MPDSPNSPMIRKLNERIRAMEERVERALMVISELHAQIRYLREDAEQLRARNRDLDEEVDRLASLLCLAESLMTDEQLEKYERLRKI